MTAQEGARQIRLRYAGMCRGCGARVPAGTTAEYDAASKTVRCIGCLEQLTDCLSTVSSPLLTDEPEAVPATRQLAQDLERGIAGQSARREHERRRTKREDAIRSPHPRLGRLILAVSEEPQSTAAWARGAVGEEKLGARLDGLNSPQIPVLHDRRIPRTVANIDHIAVCPSGVVVIDAKRYTGRPSLRSQGGLFSLRVESLMVGRRDCTKLVDGVLKQVALVQHALQTGPHPEVGVRGMLCFIDADWPLIGGSFTLRGVDVMWPKKAAETLQREGPLTETSIASVSDHLASHFPRA